MATRFSIGANYIVALAIVEYDGKPLLPIELRVMGYDAHRIAEYFSAIEIDLLTTYFDNPILNKVCSHLWDAWYMLEEGNIEGAKTMVMNSLEILLKELLPRIHTSGGSIEIRNMFEKLIGDLQDLLHHGGPAPRSLVELAISIAVSILKYLSRAMALGEIMLRETGSAK